MSNLDPICINLIFAGLGFIGGLVSTIFADRFLTVFHERRNALREFGNIFSDLKNNIIFDEIPTNTAMSTFCEQTFLTTAKAFETLKIYIKGNKRVEIRKAYREYKYPHGDKHCEHYSKFDFILYDFDEGQIKKHKLGTKKIKTGKDLLVHNLKTIIDLTK